MTGASRFRHVAVLMGGLSAEREVSLVSGEAVARALEERGYRVSRIDAGRDLPRALAEVRPDVVFNALHGRFGEDGCVQGLLELLGVPYTHSGVLASALAMDKPMAKRLFAAAGIPCPEGRVVPVEAVLAGDPMPRPYVVKPTHEGSSVGVHIVREGEDNPLRQLNRWTFGREVLVERYVAGRELTVTVLGDRALEVTEIRPRQGFYDYRAKYTEHQADHLIPAPLPEADHARALDYALRAHRALGCRGVSRADFRYDDAEAAADPAAGGLYILEVNTQPGMTPLSLVPEQAAHVGIGFADLVVRLVEEARCDG
jgi:D-alanine-D-alanine ligase